MDEFLRNWFGYFNGIEMWRNDYYTYCATLTRLADQSVDDDTPEFLCTCLSCAMGIMQGNCEFFYKSNAVVVTMCMMNCVCNFFRYDFRKFFNGLSVYSKLNTRWI